MKIVVLHVGNGDFVNQLAMLVSAGKVSEELALACTDGMMRDLNQLMLRVQERSALDLIVISPLRGRDEAELHLRNDALVHHIRNHPDKPWLHVRGLGKKRVAKMFERKGIKARIDPLSQTLTTLIRARQTHRGG